LTEAAELEAMFAVQAPAGRLPVLVGALAAPRDYPVGANMFTASMAAPSTSYSVSTLLTN
jgi:hypothetical protein